MCPYSDSSLKRRPTNVAATWTLSLLAAAFSGSIACAETWTVVEGENGATHGLWQIRIEGDTVVGNAAMFSPRGARLTYQVAGEIKDGRFVAHRVASSDRAVCTYIVEMGHSDRLEGSALCGRSAYPWRATRTSTKR